MLQPNYIPWKGVFDMISRVDTFVFYDDVQYTARDWRNRNKIKTAQGTHWISVPVLQDRDQLICDAKIDLTAHWQIKHYKAFQSAYKRAPFFDQYEYLLDELYMKQTWQKISDLDVFATKLIAKALGLNPTWVLASELNCQGAKDGEKILKICETLGCDYVLNGPAARAFVNDDMFKAKGIVTEYMTYEYEPYPQRFPPFVHEVTVLDTIFNCGPDAPRYIFKGQRSS